MNCPHCRFENPAGFRYCGSCGAMLALPEPAPTPEADANAQRRHLTVMFCDLAGSTSLSATLDPEDFRELLSRYLDTASTVARRFSGFVGQVHGDGMLIYFGYPKAREDSAILAVRAGLGILRALDELNAELALEGRAPLQVRIGAHTGLLVVGELTGANRRDLSVVVGKTPNLAARLQTLAPTGGMVVSGDTWRLVRHAFRGELLGDFMLKGIAEPVAIHRVLGEATATLRAQPEPSRAPLIGRASELETLQRAWSEACAGGSPRLVVRGEAGIGKSRLVREFLHRIADEPHTCLLAAGQSHAQSSAFLPLLELLREELGFDRGDTPEEQIERVEKFAASLALPVTETVQLLAAALSLPVHGRRNIEQLAPAAARVQLIAWWPELLRTLASRRPVIFLIEDLHWLDPSSVETIERVIAAGGIPRSMIVVTTRPDFLPTWPAEEIALERLPAAEVADFAESIAGGKDLPPELLQELVRKANGIPLFVEEMTRMVLESGVLVEREAHFESSAQLPTLAIPETLHALLMARLDRSATVREIAQIAAVIGMEFHFEMLRLLAPFDEAVLREELARLVDAGLLAQDGAFPDARFSFRHALIHAEAYQSLLRRTRQRYHEQFAGLLASRFPETLQLQPELVAHHFTEAGRHAEAVGLWLQAAVRSVDRSANHEAIAQISQALPLLESLDDAQLRVERELALTVVRGRAEAMLRGYGAAEVERTFSHARSLTRAVPESPDIYQVLGVLHAFYVARGEFDAAHEVAMEMLRIGESESYTHFLDNAWLSLATVAFYRGELREACECARRAIDFYAKHTELLPARTLDIKVAALCWGGMALVLRGRADEGLAWVRQGRDFSLTIDHPHSVVFARHILQLVHFWREEPELVLAELDGFGKLCREQGFVYWLTMNALAEGWARTRLGPLEAALELLEKGLAGWVRTGTQLAGAQYFSMRAEAQARLGKFDEALATMDEAEAFAQRTGERVYRPHVATLRAAMLVGQSAANTPRAEALLLQAIAEAREMEAHWLELRAATELARIRQSHGADGARELLAPLIDACSEGAGTAIVQQARELAGLAAT